MGFPEFPIKKTVPAKQWYIVKKIPFQTLFAFELYPRQAAAMPKGYVVAGPFKILLDCLKDGCELSRDLSLM